MIDLIKHGSLFSGIGGFDLASQWVGWNNVFQVEIDEFCQKVLTRRFPDAKRFRDIRDFDGTKWKGSVDIISGGFPCQPFSVAGKQRGKEDDRHLWPEYLRIIKEARPRWVCGENVAGIINMELDNVLSDLEGEGYSCQTLIIPACAVNAPHRRDRVWIIAYDASIRCDSRGDKGEGQRIPQNKQARQEAWSAVARCNGIPLPYSHSIRLQGSLDTDGGERPQSNDEQLHGCDREWTEQWPEVAARLCRVDDGISRRVDRIKRLKALGNSIVPQVAYQIFRAIDRVEKESCYD